MEEFPATPAFAVNEQPKLEIQHRESLQDRKAFVQVLFYEELRKRFEFECAERCFSLQCRGASGPKLLKEVLFCLLQNLEDHRVRMEARTCLWDEGQQAFVTLDSARREQLERNLTQDLETALFRALVAAASAGCEEGPCGRSLLANRRTSLENECIELLRQKTLVAEECEDLEEQQSQLSPSSRAGIAEDISTCSSQSSVGLKASPNKARKAPFRSPIISRSRKTK